MRWRQRKYRIVKRFALFPIKAPLGFIDTTEEWRWLETVYLRQFRDWPFWCTWFFVMKEDYDEYISQIKKEKER